MTQRQIPHPAGTYPRCPTCHREPRHMLDMRARPTGGHWLECPCNLNGTRYDSVEIAASAWATWRGVSLVVHPLGKVAPLHAIKGRRSRDEARPA